jgi:hypothetical protein
LDGSSFNRHGPRQRRRIVAAVLAGGVVLAVAGAALLAPAGRSASLALKPGFPGGPYLVFGCSASHTNNDDAIVFAGRPGLSHNHTYIGNRTTNASSTAASLIGKPTTCDSDADASTYWFPTLFEYRREIEPLSGIVYYVKRTWSDVAAMPAGLKMLAGNAKARKRQAKGVVAWSCSGGRKTRYSVIPQCHDDQLLQLQVNFPTCWNGKALDSGNHKSHMKYAVGTSCPKSHPVAVPRIALVLLYPPVSRYARVSSGKFATHADFINGWDQPAFETLVKELNG